MSDTILKRRIKRRAGGMGGQWDQKYGAWHRPGIFKTTGACKHIQIWLN